MLFYEECVHVIRISKNGIEKENASPLSILDGNFLEAIWLLADFNIEQYQTNVAMELNWNCNGQFWNQHICMHCFLFMYELHDLILHKLFIDKLFSIHFSGWAWN